MTLNSRTPNKEKTGPDLHAGTKYLNFMADRCFPPEGDLDVLNRVAKLRAEVEEMGLGFQYLV